MNDPAQNDTQRLAITQDMTIYNALPQKQQLLEALAGSAKLDLDLTHDAGVTTLTLAQLDVTAAQAADVGPGWEYYLDRLVDAETGADPGRRDFERAYHPAMADHFPSQFS